MVRRRGRDHLFKKQDSEEELRKMKLITVGREFGSGGRELGKRLADTLGFAYYDRELISAVAEKSELDEQYVAGLLEQGRVTGYPFTIRRTFSYGRMPQQNTMKVLIMQEKIIKELAAVGNDCVIVGRSADVLLREYHPLMLFVHAEMKSKVQRCRERAMEGESLTDREIIHRIKQVDAGRAKHRELIAGGGWGCKESYHLCINTSGLSIRQLIPPIAEYAQFWFRRTTP